MDNKNPWTGINSWREFLYDAQHPLRMLSRAYEELGKDAVIFLVLVVVILGLYAAIIITGPQQ